MDRLVEERVVRLAEELTQIIPAPRLFVKHCTTRIACNAIRPPYAGTNTTACQGGTVKSCQ
jgi:hypothetical protein